MTANVRLGHVAIPAQDPNRLAQFYHDFLRLDVTLQGSLPALGQFIFLSELPAERPQSLTFMTNLAARHIAWQAESLAALKAVYSEAKAHGIAIDRALNHRVTLSLYFHDPEGNGIEVFWATGESANGLFAEPLDLALLEQPEPASAP